MRQYLVLCILGLLLPASCLFAQEEEEEPAPRFRTVPWAILAGAGTDFDSYSLTLAARRGAFGLGFGYRRNTEFTVPAYSTSAPPTGEFIERTFEVSKVGVDVYAAYSIAEGISGFGSIGGYTKINTILDSANGQWYRSANSPDWSGAEIAYGAGLELNPIDWLIIGIGYQSVRGFCMHLGYTW